MPVEAAALRGVTGMPPFIPPAPVLMPVPEPSLAAMLIHQIDYYFRYFDTTFFSFFHFCSPCRLVILINWLQLLIYYNITVTNLLFVAVMLTW